MRVIDKITINGSMRQVWDVVSSPEAFSKLMPDIESFNFNSDLRGQVGASWIDTVKLPGALVDTNWVVTKWQERQSISADFSSLRRGGHKPKQGTIALELSETKNGTTLALMWTIHSDQRNQGFMSSWLDPLMSLSLKRMVSRLNKNVKNAVESIV
jgi:carbon monoxide dehydrogenase subunit G